MRLSERFMVRFPEFARTDQNLMGAVFDEAKMEVDPVAWGEKYQSGLLMLAAHKLACSPFGEPARLDPGSGTTLYGVEFERMRRSLGYGARVI